MSEAERQTWDRRYREGDYRPRSWPSPFLDAWLPRLPRGRALDIACGAGRNALRLAEAGFRVDAVDIAESAIALGRAEGERRGLDVEWRVADLDDAALDADAYDLVTVFRYVNRLLWPRLADALTADGWLIIEHHLVTAADVEGPSTPDFRLEPQELLESFAALRIIFYEETIEIDPAGHRYALERIVACKGDPGF